MTPVQTAARYEVRWATPSAQDAERYCGLFNTLYVRKVNAAYFRWRCFESPFPSFSRFMVGPEGGLLACYGMHVLPFAGEARGGLAVDIMVAPQHQGQGLFRALVADVQQVAQERFSPDFFYVMANERAFHAHTGATGWSCPAELVTWTAQCRRCVPTSGVQFTEIEEFGQEFEALYQEFAEGHPGLLSVRRDTAYLRWRFLSNPWYRYDLLRGDVDGRLTGYMALKTFRRPEDGVVFGDIVDIVWRQDEPTLLHAMLECALDRFAARGVQDATAWLQTNTLLDQVGQQVGFRPGPQKRYLCLRATNPRYAYLADGARWFVTLSDSEIY